LRNLIEKKGLEALCEENNDIFFSIATTLVPVTASYYDEGRDDGQKRVQMSEFFYRSTFRRDTKTCNEPEDHVSLIFGLNCKLLEQAANGCEGSEALAKEIFVEIINPFIGAFEKALYKHESALFYKEVAVILNAFMAFERFLLHVAEPKYEEPTTKALWQEAKDRKPFVQRVRRNLDEIQL
jgi:TorA maturation chaperone TorD